MTRRWIDHRQLMRLISLFLVRKGDHQRNSLIRPFLLSFSQIDEVHILNEKRGACLEACVSRMQVCKEVKVIFKTSTKANFRSDCT
jgi:sulfur relay (sulfurtransferase) complex TusBCD TusD component (DsrE family)